MYKTAEDMLKSKLSEIEIKIKITSKEIKKVKTLKLIMFNTGT
jgi:hypothetical protein